MPRWFWRRHLQQKAWPTMEATLLTWAGKAKHFCSSSDAGAEENGKGEEIQLTLNLWATVQVQELTTHPENPQKRPAAPTLCQCHCKASPEAPHPKLYRYWGCDHPNTILQLCLPNNWQAFSLAQNSHQLPSWLANNKLLSHNNSVDLAGKNMCFRPNCPSKIQVVLNTSDQDNKTTSTTVARCSSNYWAGTPLPHRCALQSIQRAQHTRWCEALSGPS